MPLYEYRCKACEQVFEYMQSMSAGAKRKCEECGGRLAKLVSRSGFVLKGSGWYETDFKGGSKSKKGDSDGADDSPKKDAEKPAKSADKAASKAADKKAGETKKK